MNVNHFITCDQTFFFFSGAQKCGSIRVGNREKGRKKERLIQLLHESSAIIPESGLLSNWSKNKRFFQPHSNNWLHDCMFDFQCNFKIMATTEGDVNSELQLLGGKVEKLWGWSTISHIRVSYVFILLICKSSQDHLGVKTT